MVPTTQNRTSQPRDATTYTAATPDSGRRNINAWYQNFCDEFQISLPYKEVSTPSKRTRSPGHEIMSKSKFLYFKYCNELDDVVKRLREDYVQFMPNEDLRLNTIKDYLSKKCSECSSICGAHGTTTPLPTKSSVDAYLDGLPDTPPSPTLTRKHAKDIPADMARSFTTDATTLSLGTVWDAETSASGQATPATSIMAQSQTDLSTQSEDLTQPSFSSPVSAKSSPPMKESPGNLNYRVRSIAKDGLPALPLTPFLLQLPFDLRVEAYRVMRATNVDAKTLEDTWSRPLKFVTLHTLVDKLPEFNHGFETDYEDTTLYARLRFSEKTTGPVFDLDVLPPAREDSHSLQRKFGGSRFLVVDLPKLSKPPSALKGQDIENAVHEMLTEPHEFLGRTWTAFHVQGRKGKKKHRTDNTTLGTFQVVFFATSGDDLEEVSVTKLLDWALCFQLNKRQTACKLYARIDMAMSRTKPTITFKLRPTDYKVPDALATPAPDDCDFDDPALQDMFAAERSHFDGEAVMDDGCALMSADAMEAIRKQLELPYLPAAVQGRIFGAKGVWFRDDTSPSSDPTCPNIWIQIKKSQIKIHRDLESGNDDQHFTFNVVNWSRPAKHSVLYPGFLPILKDRGVPKEVMLEMAREQVESRTKEYLKALEDGFSIYRWVYDNRDLIHLRERHHGIQSIAEFPTAQEEIVVRMVEAGFHPAECSYLGEQCHALGQQAFGLEGKKFKSPLPQSANIIGISDPSTGPTGKGRVPPGHVHYHPSTIFQDNVTGESWSSLHGITALIARNPSMRNSDIQKVKVVDIPELRHLSDVVVLSREGRRSVASMLSGGDFDGDTYWICWDRRLVDPFMNAPAPAPVKFTPSNPFHMEQDTTKFEDIVESEGSMDAGVKRWLARSMKSRMEQSLLGHVTNLHTSLVYQSRDLSSVQANLLVDLHDLLVDSDKQGYRLTAEAFATFRKENDIPATLPRPAHRKYTSADTDDDAAVTNNLAKSEPTDEITDELYYTVLAPITEQTLSNARKTLDAGGNQEHHKWEDKHLSSLYEQILELAEHDSDIQAEISELQKGLAEIRERWTRGMKKYHHTLPTNQKTLFTAAVQDCRQTYSGILPVNPSHAKVEEWLRQDGRAATTWERIKASYFAKHYWRTGQRMLFSIAGNELCLLKAQWQPQQARSLPLSLYMAMQPRKKAMFDSTAVEDEDVRD